MAAYDREVDGRLSNWFFAHLMMVAQRAKRTSLAGSEGRAERRFSLRLNLCFGLAGLFEDEFGGLGGDGS